MRHNRHNANAEVVNRITHFDYTVTGVLNVFLAAAVIFLTIYYVVVSNAITASNYRIGLLNRELSDVTEINGTLTAQELFIEGSSVILNFARNHNMVEASYVTHIFEGSDVAALR